MCGINGLIDFDTPPDRSRFQALTEQMRHRGPDGGHVFSDGPVALGHRRLRVLDLSELADQPMFSEDRKVAIVFNGEIYNFKELRRELQAHGRVFKTSGDTEVLMHAWEQWGPRALIKLNGMFAFAILDSRSGEPVIWLARDRFGIKPLFYSVNEQRLAFASELKPLLQVPWISKEIDPLTLFHFLKHSHVPTPLSILKDVQQLAPGSWLKFSARGTETGTFWSATDAFTREPADAPATAETLVAELEHTLLKVIKRQTVADVPLGAFLSGGIDSSLLVWAACESGFKGMHTFTIGYKEAEFDESAAARQVAAHFGTRHHELITQPQDYFKLIPELPVYFDQPFADPTALPSLLLARFARDYVTVALSGDGGDELFFGYTYQHFLVSARRLLGAPAGPRHLASNALKLLGSLSSNNRVRSLRKLGEILDFENEPELFQYFIGTIGPVPFGRLRSLLNAPLGATDGHYARILGDLRGADWRQKVEVVFLETFLPDTVLQKTDRAGMAWGLEARVPFLDHEMVEFASRVPFRFKYNGRYGKIVLRELLKRKLPSNLHRKPKHGFSIPLREWLRGDLKWLLDEYLGPERLKREGIFNAANVGAVVSEHLNRSANHSHLLWSLINFQLWRERYLR
ncbi:MAG TPA: asparagine synthase (glutamine-hydrolyzing) [Bdellovibrionales bacterium]|nr:asparagine synthase (glutamine-hydrolyzing) [Bdellovibrionales bacterium]